MKMLLDLIRLIFKDINRRKFSSFLTLFAISLGILSIYLITLVSLGFEQSVEQQFEQFGSNRLYVSENFGASSSFSSGLTDNDINLIESRSYVDKVYPYYTRNSQLEFSNEFRQKTVLGVELSQDYFIDTNFELAQGRFPNLNEKFSMVVGPEFVENGFDKELRVGSNIYIRDNKFKVVGILESIGNPQDDSSVYVNIDTLREIFEAGDTVGLVDVIIVNGEDVSLARDNLQIYLDNKLGEDIVEVTSPEQLLEQVGNILSIIQYTLGSIALISLIVGAFGIINTMYVIVTEKTKEIGIMKSIGARNEDILFLYVFQAGVFGFLGAILGIILGAGLTILFESFAQSAGYSFLKINIDLTVTLSLLVFGFVIGIISGYLPARKASKLNIIDTLRK